VQAEVRDAAVDHSFDWPSPAVVAGARETASDLWADWLLRRRYGADAGHEAVVKRVVASYADRVIDQARLAAGMHFADVGCGDGLLTFRAFERFGPNLRAVLTDISAPLLQHARQTAESRGVSANCSFLECSAERLAGIADSSLDVAMTRAAVAYVTDKQAVFAEFKRVLKGSGRIALAEPILQDEAFAVRALRKRVEAASGQPHDRFLALLHRWKAAQYPDSEEAYARNPLVNFSERDLLNFVRNAGFVDIHIELHIDVMPALVTSWDVYLQTSPHPWAPSLGQILGERFSEDERRFFESLVRPTVESGQNVDIERIAYVSARKPPGASG
jgi:ubiquinone/menaquinone biosynthesis C-methylase UbiE